LRKDFGEPQEIVVWGRGMNGLEFFELTPLLGTFDNPKSAADLRTMLLTEGKAGLKTQPGATDLQNLELLSKPSNSTSKGLQWQREIALEQMRLLKLVSFEDLFKQYEKQKAFARSSLTANPSQMAELFDAPGNVGSESAILSNLIKFLGEKKVLNSVLRTKVSSIMEPRIVGYVRRVSSAGVSKVGGDIFVSVSGYEPEQMPTTFEIELEESLTDKLFTAVPTTLVGLVGTFGGALIGYKFFLYQQNRLRQLELEKRFADKKVELAKKIRTLFKGDYNVLRASNDVDLEKAKQIRDVLIAEDIYAILLPEEVIKVNNICDETKTVKGQRTEALHNVLESNFREFMV
jgi:predicted RNA-binding protein